MPTQSKIDIEPSACWPVRPTLKTRIFASAILVILTVPVLCRAQAAAPGIAAKTARPPQADAAAASPSVSSLVSAGAFGGFSSVAPGSWIEIYGSNLASGTRSWASSDFNGVTAPTSLDGTSVTIGGKSAFVDYISPGQVDAQVPSNVGTGPQAVVVTANGVGSNSYTVTVNAEQPGLLAPSSFDIAGTRYVVALFSDGVTYVLPPGSIAGVPSRRAQPGDNITLYGVGFGAVIPAIPAGQIVQQDNALALPFQLNFGQAQAAVTYDGLAPGAVGLYQFNVTLPDIASSDTVPVTFTLGGVAGTQTLYISIQGGNAAAQLQTLTLSAPAVAGGGTVQGTVVLSEPAPPGGAIIALASDSSDATVPTTVTVPAAATSATFTVSTISVTSNQTVNITATYGGSSAQAVLTVIEGASTATITSLNVLAGDFFPAGYPPFQLPELLVSLNPGNATYSAGFLGSLSFVNGSVSNQNQTFTFSMLQNGISSFAIPGGPDLTVSSASLTFTLGPPQLGSGATAETGSLTAATLTVTGAPSGGASVTISGPVTGNYIARLSTQ